MKKKEDIIIQTEKKEDEEPQWKDKIKIKKF